MATKQAPKPERKPKAQRQKQQPASGIDPNRLYSYEEIAEFMGVTWWVVRNLVREGRLGYTKVSAQRLRLVSGANYLDYLAANTVPAENSF
jgi:excisionase family DNA binding protein